MLKHVTTLLALAACSSGPSVEASPVTQAEPVEPPALLLTDTAAPAADPDEFLELASTPSETAPSASTPSETAPVTVTPTDDAPLTAKYSLKRGETLAHFARWSGLPVEVIAEHSSLGLTEVYPVGTEIIVPLDPEARARVELARTQHHVARADGYLDSRGGVAGTDFYTVRSGDTAWSISRNELGIPVWLLETYNPSVDLDRIAPGTRLMVPALADTVADAGAPALALQGPTE